MNGKENKCKLKAEVLSESSSGKYRSEDKVYTIKPAQIPAAP